MQFNDWLATQRKHEALEHKVNHRELACDPFQMSRYVLTQMHAALTTMETARMNIPAYAQPEDIQRKAWEDNRDSFVDNVVSVLTCVGSMLTAVGTTDEELARRYTAKLAKGAALRRLAESAVKLPSWKCYRCKNELPGTVLGYGAISGQRVCSEGCWDAVMEKSAELVLVPAPDVSAVDLAEDEEDLDA